MKRPSLIAVTLITLAMAVLAHADPDRSAMQIRKEYRGSEAPIHLVFVSEVLGLKEAAASNRDIALRIVHRRMQLESEEAAEAFLSRMVAAATELESEYSKVLDAMLCGPDVPRSKKALYHRLDRMDDLRAIKAHNVYVKFISSLNESQQAAMTAWLEEGKEGFYYLSPKHKSAFENTGVDVVYHVDMVCALRAH